MRPLEKGDKVRLLEFFKRLPEEERYYLKENVTSPAVIDGWTSNIDFEHVIPIVALVDRRIVADATLHRTRAPARRQVGELRVAVDPSHREVGLGRRLIRELLDISAALGLTTATFELVGQRQEPAILAAISMGFEKVATLKGRVRDLWVNSQDLVLLESSLKDREVWWNY